MSTEASRSNRPNRLRRWCLRNVVPVVIIVVFVISFRVVVAESFHPTSAAVAPEVPQGARVWAYKLTASYNRGDIVVFRSDIGTAYLARVISLDHSANEMTVGRNGEEERVIKLGQLVGRVVLTTR